MQVWSRDPNSFKLTRSNLPSKSEPKSDPVMAQPTLLQERFYPMRTSLPSCIRLPEANGNNFELKLQFINTLSKFHSLEFENTYFFIREFEEVCLMMSMHYLVDDAVRLRFISFALKDLTMKWLSVDSITSWDDFVKAFFKKLYPIYKIALIRKNSM